MAWNGLTDGQWAMVAPHLPKQKVEKKGGRPWANDRKRFEGILWVLWTGAPWSVQAWEEDGTLLDLWRAFLTELQDEEKIKWDECFMGGTFASANVKRKGPGRQKIK